jgi:hypothetical protein
MLCSIALQHRLAAVGLSEANGLANDGYKRRSVRGWRHRRPEDQGD